MFIWISSGGRRWRIIGKSGAWTKIFGWKYDKPTENIWFEIRKILDIDGIINLWGWT